MSTTVQGSILSKEMQRDPKLATYGSYQYSKLTPNAALPTSVTVGGDIIEIELPAKCINHFFDRMEFDLTLVGTTTFNNMFLDGIAPIQTLELVSYGGQHIVNTVHFNNFTNATMRRTHKIEKVLSKERIPVIAATNSYFEGLSCCNGELTIRQPISTATGVLTAPIEKYLEPLSVGESATGASLVIKYRLNMGDLKDTFFNCCRDVNFNEIVLLRITTAAQTKVGYVSSTTVSTSASTKQTAGYTFSNFAYYVAIQKDQDIIDSVNRAPRQEMNIPFVWTTKIQTATVSADNTLTIRINTPNGSRLLRMYWAAYAAELNTDARAFSVYDKDNLTQTKVATFYITVDGEKRQMYDFTCSRNEDYNTYRNLFKGSCILSANDHYKYFTHCENFCDNYALCDEFEYSKTNWIEGTPIEKEIKLDINFLSGTEQCHNYIFTVCQRKLIIDKQLGIIVNSDP